MFPEIKVLQDEIQLYNNIAEMGDHVGRLYATLEIYPSPRIYWEFEVIGNEVNQKGKLPRTTPANPLIGYNFYIDQPYIARDCSDYVTPLELVSGIAGQARYGEINNAIHKAVFYIPNARFQSRNLFGQQKIEKYLKTKKGDFNAGVEGRLIDTPLDDTWHVRLETYQNALDWLDENKSNIGTKITTIGVLYTPMADDVKFVDYPTISLKEAQNYVDILCILLSYVNGGYIGPIYIESRSHVSEPSEIAHQSAIALAHRITPLELLGRSWLAFDSDLESYLSCFSTLKRMQNDSPWRETFGIILAWYFQAIQPENRQLSGKQWPIVANALGTALERLSYTILVLEEEDSTTREKNEALFTTGDNKLFKKYWKDVLKKDKISRTGKRLQLLLERIGITLERGFWDVNEVKDFLEVRNEATHPKKGNVKEENIFYLLDRATQWVDETLLWRLGYSSTYWARTVDGWQSTQPRYDLNNRNPKW